MGLVTLRQNPFDSLVNELFLLIVLEQIEWGKWPRASDCLKALNFLDAIPEWGQLYLTTLLCSSESFNEPFFWISRENWCKWILPNMIGIILKLSKTDIDDIFSVSQIVERKKYFTCRIQLLKSSIRWRENFYSIAKRKYRMCGSTFT